MATIRASCDHCGDIEMTSRDLTVRVCRNDGSGTYCFSCPLCHERGVRDAEPRVVLTVEEVGSPGEGLIMHLNGDQARRLRVAVRDALREIGEPPGD